MSQFQPIETSSMIICWSLFENILVEEYGLLVNLLIKLRSSSCVININPSDDVWMMILIQFELVLQTFTFYLKVANMVNIFLRLHKLLSIFPLGIFILVG